MVVFDGDSLLVPFHIKENKTWAHLQGRKYANLATKGASSRDCLGRIGKVGKLGGDLYVLQVGLWSCNHEDLGEFEQNVGEILRKVQCPKVLVTPLWQEAFDTSGVVRILRGFSEGVVFIDVIEHMLGLDEAEREKWLLTANRNNCHFSEYGSIKMAQLFNQRMRHAEQERETGPTDGGGCPRVET